MSLTNFLLCTFLLKFLLVSSKGCMYNLQTNGSGQCLNKLEIYGCIFFSDLFLCMINNIERGYHLKNKTRLLSSCFVQVGIG